MSNWTILTNHGAVLVKLSANNRMTALALSQELGITERSVRRIINDLESAGYLEKKKVGRDNRYKVKSNKPLRSIGFQEKKVADIINLLKNPEERCAQNWYSPTRIRT